MWNILPSLLDFRTSSHAKTIHNGEIKIFLSQFFQFRPISVDPLQELPKERQTETKSVKDGQ